MRERQNNTPSSASLEPSFNQHSLQDWQTIAAKSLRGESLESLSHLTANGLSIDPLYSDRPAFTEKIQATALQRWDNRLAVIGPNAQAQNTSLLNGLHGGICSVQIQLNNSKHSSLPTIDVLPTALGEVQLDIIPISIMAGSEFSFAARQLESIWSERGVDAQNAMASFNADPIGTLATDGRLSTDLDELLTELSTLAQYSHKTFPLVQPVCVNSACYHNAGASLEQELVASIATATIYMQHMLDAGMSAQSAHDAITFQIACDSDTIVNVVKQRALKSLWYHVANHLGVSKPALVLVVETSLRMQSRSQPWINHLRNVSAAAAAAMGGAQSIIVHPHNRIDGEFVDDNIELGARVARNIAIILSEESAMTFVHDPMGGAYAVEHLTNNLCKKTWAALQQLENDGGLIQSLTSGQWQAQIANVQKQRVARLRNEQDVQISVNRYTSETAPRPDKSKRSDQPKPDSTDALALRTVRDAAEFEASL